MTPHQHRTLEALQRWLTETKQPNELIPGSHASTYSDAGDALEALHEDHLDALDDAANNIEDSERWLKTAEEECAKHEDTINKLEEEIIDLKQQLEDQLQNT